MATGCKEELHPPEMDKLLRFEHDGPQELPADGASTITYRVILDPRTDTSIKVVDFTTTCGTFAGSTTYRAPILSDRTASAVLRAGRDVGPCSIKVSVASLSREEKITLVLARPNSMDLELSAYTVDTASNATVTLTVDAMRTIGMPTKDQPVWFTFEPDTSLTGLVLPTMKTIDENGNCTATLANPFKRAGAFVIKAKMIAVTGDTLEASRTVVYQ